MAPESNYSLLIFSSHGQRSSSNCWSLKNDDLHPKCCLLIYLWSFAWWVPNFLHWLTLREDYPFSFVGHNVKGQGQTVVLYCCPLNISWPFLWKVAKLGTANSLDSRRPLLMSKSHGQRSICWSWKIAARSIFLDTFARRLPNLLQWMTSESKCSLLIFKLHGQKSRSNRWSLWKLPNLVQWMPLAKRRFCGFLVTLSKVKVKLLVLEKMMILVNSLTYGRLLDGYQTCYSGWL